MFDIPYITLEKLPWIYKVDEDVEYMPNAPANLIA